MPIRFEPGSGDPSEGEPGRVVVVFTEALNVPVQERAALVERLCAGDESLRQKVEALLRAHERAGDFLEAPATETVGLPLPRRVGKRRTPSSTAHRKRKKDSR
jgi:hypothetical protein